MFKGVELNKIDFSFNNVRPDISKKVNIEHENKNN